MNLNGLVTFSVSEPIVCGKINFKLANETQNDILYISNLGILQTKHVKDAAWLGSHTVEFEYFLTKLDPTAT